jgi:hypothetical protein
MRPCSQRPYKSKEGEAIVPSSSVHQSDDKFMKLYRSILLVAVLAPFFACSSQGEGERCSYANKDADCESGLVCIEAQKLAEYDITPDYAADRCCPVDLLSSSDPRCKPSSGASGQETVGSSGGSTGAGGASSETAGGTSGVAGSSDAGSAGVGGDSAGAPNQDLAGSAGTAGG